MESIGTKMTDVDICIEVVYGYVELSTIAPYSPLNISETVRNREAWFQMSTSGKWPMWNRMVKWPMTLRDPWALNWHKFEFSGNFAGFRRLWRQQQLNEWR